MATQGYQREDSRDRTNKNMLNLNFQLSQPSPYPNIMWAKKNQQHQSVKSNNLLFKNTNMLFATSKSHDYLRDGLVNVTS